MSFEAAQNDLNGRFTYKADQTGERWSILRGSGPISGDCEDYSLTLVWLAEGRSLIRFWLAFLTLRYVIWHCRSPGGAGHAVMWVRGRGWTDNIQRRVVSRADLKAKRYRLWFPYIAPMMALKFALRPVARLIHALRG